LFGIFAGHDMVEVRKRDKESSDSLVRRFSNVVRGSGILLEARKKRFHVTKPNKKARRDAAQRRTELTKERDKLIKLGVIDEFSQSGSSRNWRNKR